MVERSRVFAIAGLVFSVLAMALVVASFAGPYWVETEQRVQPSGFERMGVWVVCFHDYYPVNRPITNKRYEGCWSSISYEMRDLADHFFPDWLVAIQVMMTLAMVMCVACVVFNVIYFINCCRGNMERIFVLVSTALSFIAAFFILVSCTIFGVRVDQDRQWLPQPDSVQLAWAYGLGILAGFLALFSGMCMATEFYRLRLENLYDRGANSSGSPAVRYNAPPPKYDQAVSRR